MPPQYTNRRNRTVLVTRQPTSSSANSQPARVKYAVVVVPAILLGMMFLSGSGAGAETDQVTPTEQVITTKAYEPVKPKIVYKEFPGIDEKNLTAVQKRIVAIARSEYTKHPTGYDQNVMRYTEGSREPWCANFISWVRDQAGIPYEHPTTGYWRIPGVSTLRDYYRQSDAYFAAGEYVPKLGDVAFYEGDTADANSSEHVALVLGVEGDKLITIGGNETDKGILQIRYNKLAENERGLVGFGRTNVR